MFSAPVPGQSLTSEPKNYNWENPPKFSKPEDALMFHLDSLRKPDKIKSVLGLLSLGLDVVTMTEGILRGAVAEGYHTIDVSLIIGPIIHEYIVGSAEAAGIDYEEGIEEDGYDPQQIEYALESKKSKEILKSIKGGKKFDLPDSPQEEMEAKEPVEEPAEEIKEKPMGLMARGVS
tara:strand:+ start:3306 stop:3833 length:528 start_codon:yes stop_codon:yes gene_type:complete